MAGKDRLLVVVGWELFPLPSIRVSCNWKESIRLSAQPGNSAVLTWVVLFALSFLPCNRPLFVYLNCIFGVFTVQGYVDDTTIIGNAQDPDWLTTVAGCYLDLGTFLTGGCLGWSRTERPSVCWTEVSKTLWSSPPSWLNINSWQKHEKAILKNNTQKERERKRERETVHRLDQNCKRGLGWSHTDSTYAGATDETT